MVQLVQIHLQPDNVLPDNIGMFLQVAAPDIVNPQVLQIALPDNIGMGQFVLVLPQRPILPAHPENTGMEQRVLQTQLQTLWIHLPVALKRAELGILQPIFAKCRIPPPLVLLDNIGMVQLVLVLTQRTTLPVHLDNIGMAQVA
jgi:hypothetical protein